MLLSLFGVLGLFFLTMYGLRRFSRRISASGGRLRVLDRAMLGRDSAMLVANVAGKLVLIGVTSQSVEKIADLDMSLSEYLEYTEDALNQDGHDTGQQRSFKEALGIAFRNSIGLKQKEEK